MSRISQNSEQRLPSNILPGIEDPNPMSGQPVQPGHQPRMGSSASGATSRVSLFKQPSFLTSPGFIPPGAPQTSNPSCEYGYMLHCHRYSGVPWYEILNSGIRKLLKDEPDETGLFSFES